ncbi:hypothetical protein [Candidatus Viridilinea mediisalina]|uniref:Periplasmic heavy metal sensor n=1 Tax=Candidatus Viridilinea mediisalina TaxID=2024553 RepID=A0A2A6RF43_9CHLR|nr:hypothetical protein [Candidatus Viridilinea mediisalina]PDW01563.1 hypothetical protein CJ255_18470 [Candidatus Viridilinea mediisalina]
MKRIATIITSLVAGALVALVAMSFAPATHAQRANTDCPSVSRGEMGDRGEARGRTHSLVAMVAEKLNQTRDELIAQLGTEGTLAGALEQGGVSVAPFVDDVVANRTERLNAAVEAGRITREQADEHLGEMRARIETRLNQPFGERDAIERPHHSERPERPGRGPRP